MANTKITDLNSLTAEAGDEIPVNRAGADGKITAGDIAALAATTELDNLGTTAINAHLIPGSDAAVDLGTTTVGFNDLHLGSGGIVNFDGGDVTITHAANTLAVAGGTVSFRGGDVSESAASADRLDVGISSDGNPKIVFENNGAQIWCMDVEIGGALRWYTPGAEKLRLTTGALSAASGSSLDLGTTSLAWDECFLTTIQLGHASDTSLTRSAAGVLAVETVPVAMTGKQTIWVPAAAMTPRTTNGAQATTREINSITLGVLAFDQTTDEGANFTVTFPKSWGAGTITYKFHWTVTGGGAAETVQFEVRGGSFADSAAINVTGLGTAVATSDTFITDDDVHVSAESSAVTLSNAAVDVPTIFEIIRDVSDDDLTADCELIGVEIFYTTTAGNDA
jgi:hypothetical protein